MEILFFVIGIFIIYAIGLCMGAAIVYFGLKSYLAEIEAIKLILSKASLIEFRKT